MKRIIVFLLVLFLGLVAKSVNLPKLFDVQNSEFECPEFIQVLDYQMVFLIKSVEYTFVSKDDNLQFVENHRLRILFLDDEKAKNFKIEIPFCGTNKIEDVFSYKAYKFENAAQVKKTKYKNNTLKFYNLDSQKSKAVIQFDDLKKGDILELVFSLSSYDFVKPREINFYDKYPIQINLVTGLFMDFMKFRFDLMGNQDEFYHSHNDDFMSLSFVLDFSKDPRNVGYFFPGVRSQRFVHFRFRADLDSFYIQNILPQYAEPLMPVKNYGLNKLILRPSKSTLDIGYSDPLSLYAYKRFSHRLYLYSEYDEKDENLLSLDYQSSFSGYVFYQSDNWDKMYKMLKKDSQFYKSLLKVPPTPTELENLYENDVNDTLKSLQQIFDFVKKDKSNNNITLLQYIKKLGVEAYPVFAVNRKNGLFDTTYANRSQFDKLLVYIVSINGQKMFLDIDDESFGLRNPLYINNLAFVFKNDGYEFVEMQDDNLLLKYNLKFEDYKKSPFVEDYRIFPVDFVYKREYNFEKFSEIPVDFSPKTYLVESGIDGIFAKYSSQIVDQKVKETWTIFIHNTFVDSQKYFELKSFFDNFALN